MLAGVDSKGCCPVDSSRLRLCDNICFKMNASFAATSEGEGFPILLVLLLVEFTSSLPPDPKIFSRIAFRRCSRHRSGSFDKARIPGLTFDRSPSIVLYFASYVCNLVETSIYCTCTCMLIYANIYITSVEATGKSLPKRKQSKIREKKKKKKKAKKLE